MMKNTCLATMAFLLVLVPCSFDAEASNHTWLETDADLRIQQQPAGEDAPGTDPLLDEPDSWTVSVSPYLWIPAQDGDLAVNGTPASVDLSVGDVFDAVSDNFDSGLTLHLEFTKDDLTLFVDAMYLSLQTNEANLSGSPASVRQNQGIFELGFAYRITEPTPDAGEQRLILEPLAGLRIQYLSLDIDPKGAPSTDGDQLWFDGFVGARARLAISDRLSLKVRGDIGAGHSDLTWSALAGADFRLADGVSLMLGYKALHTDYDDGHGPSRFVYDMTLHGPFVALTIEF